MPFINITTGIKPATQIPLDSKAYARTLLELQSLGVNNVNAYLYYDGLIIFCVENKLKYIWREEKTVNEVGGLLASSFVYPGNAVVDGIDYSNRIFNLFPDISTQLGLWILIDDFYIIKNYGNGNSNILILEQEDQVFLKKVTEDNETIMLFGQTYKGGDQSLRSSYLSETSIQIS